MYESQVIDGFLFPPHEQASSAVGPTMCAFDNPASGAAALATNGGIAVTLWHVEYVTPALYDPSNWCALIPLIQAQVLLAASSCAGAIHRDGRQRLGHQFLIVDIRAGNRDAQWYASTIGESGTLDSQFAAIGRVFPCLFPPRGMPWSSSRPNSASSSRSLCVGRTPLGTPSIVAGTRPAEPTVESNDAPCWRNRTPGAKLSTGNLCVARKRFRLRRFANLREDDRHEGSAGTSEAAVRSFSITFRESAQTCRPNCDAYTPPCKKKKGTPSGLTHEVAICSVMG